MHKTFKNGDDSYIGIDLTDVASIPLSRHTELFAHTLRLLRM